MQDFYNLSSKNDIKNLSPNDALDWTLFTKPFNAQTGKILQVNWCKKFKMKYN